MLAIVLSGGGAKGAYEAGVCKALRKLKIKYNIVTGTSIGAINGMMMAQNELYKCLRLWKNISFKQIYEDFENCDNNLDIFKKYTQKFLEGGIDTKKIEKLINSNYKPDKLYNSKISFGVVSYNLSDLNVVYSTTKNTKPDDLKKQILASATCFPAFKPTKIGNDTYIDGGFSDNLPINLAIDLGADEIIAVDLKTIGIKKRVKNKSLPILYIEPTSKLDSFFMFEKNAARKMIKLGYNDTLKKFKKYEGNIYTFKKGTTNIIKKYEKNIVKIINKYDKKMMKKSNLKMLDIIEYNLQTLEIPVEKLYSVSSLNKEIFKILDNVENINLSELKLEEIKKIFDKKSIIKYFYTSLKKHGKINEILLDIFDKEFIFSVYLTV